MANFNWNGFGAHLGAPGGALGVGDTMTQTIQAPSNGQISVRTIDLKTLRSGAAHPAICYNILYIVVGPNGASAPLSVPFPTQKQLVDSGFVCKFGTLVPMANIIGQTFRFSPIDIVARSGQQIVVVTSSLVDFTGGAAVQVPSFNYMSVLGDDSFATLPATLR